MLIINYSIDVFMHVGFLRKDPQKDPVKKLANYYILILKCLCYS